MADKERNDTRLGAAIVSGGFATVVALITGIFGWLNREQPAPPPTPPVVISSIPGPQTGPITTLSGRGEQHNSPPKLTTNFGAFQRIVRSAETTDKEKRAAIDECKGELVVWRGYVDTVTPNPELGEKAYTVTLYEDRKALRQSFGAAALGRQPALCRFPTNPFRQISSLQQGQDVTISGRFVDHSVFGTELVDCKLSRLHD